MYRPNKDELANFIRPILLFWRPGDWQPRSFYKDLLREAEHERLIRRALAGRPMGDRLYRRTLAWLGHRLAAWGEQLQKRYGDASLTPKPLASQSR